MRKGDRGGTLRKGSLQVKKSCKDDRQAKTRAQLNLLQLSKIKDVNKESGKVRAREIRDIQQKRKKRKRQLKTAGLHLSKIHKENMFFVSITDKKREQCV